MNAKRNTPEGDRLDVLVTLGEAFERKHYPLDLTRPIEATISTWTERAAAARPDPVHRQPESGT